jgi:hypothetical protein
VLEVLNDAASVTDRSGWDAVPWEDLLNEMLAVAPPEG